MRTLSNSLAALTADSQEVIENPCLSAFIRGSIFLSRFTPSGTLRGAESWNGPPRAAIEGRFPPGSPLVTSLPRIYPQPGHTPDPVTAAGTWDAAQSKARLTWSASPDPELDHYDIRSSNSGSTYDTETEATLGSVPKDASPLEYLTAAGLGATGASARFRIYVVLTTGNERGSETVTVTRP